MKKYQHYSLTGLMFSSLFTMSCDDDVPPIENEEEVIDLVTLTFAPTGSDPPIVQTATDPDGAGTQDIAPDGVINLDTDTDYTLTIALDNVANGESVTEEIEEEDEEHIFFFSFDEALFSNPAGDGNLDNRADDVNYVDFDDNQDEVGLTTNWTTASSASNGLLFRVVLKHQPDIKSSTSTSDQGTTDIDVSWTINIQ